MGILTRNIFREIFSGALLGTFLFTFILFLEKLGRLFEILVRSSAPPRTVARLFALVLPEALTFTIPLGALVGVLIALSRRSSDGEITAMRASGVPSRRVIFPVMLFGTLAMLVAGACSLWLTPYAIHERYKILNHLAAAQLTAAIQPRVFEEQFPDKILYVGDVIQGPVIHWRNVFLADLTTPEATAGGPDHIQGPKITIATEAIAVPDIEQNRIQLTMMNGSTHEVDKESKYIKTSFPKGEQLLEALKRNELRATRTTSEMDTVPLYRRVYRDKPADKKDWIEASIELHQRMALPLACVLLSMVAIPLGVSTRKAGKSTAFVLTVLLAFFYYMGLISLIGLGRQGALPVAVAVWTPNVLFALAGIILMIRLEAPGDRDWVGVIKSFSSSALQRLRGTIPSPPARLKTGALFTRFWLLPQIIDTYVLSSFLFYFLLLLVGFTMMTQVFTFFELLPDLVKNRIPMSRMLTYLFFLTPNLIYVLAPLAVLMAILITFGILSKHNEVTALRASGVSLHRIAIPVLLISSAFSLALFAFDHYYVPEANRIQDAIRNEIKGRPVQTYLRPDRKWIFGQGSRIYYYKYLEPNENVMLGVSVYELDPHSFLLRHHISAEKARWESSLHTWVFQNGWSRDLESGQERYRDFKGAAATFPELSEPPAYFLKEVKQHKQMNFKELTAYIRELKQSGFDTVRLQVQLHKKFSAPLFAFIMAMIGVPFAFLAGNRGAMAGVGVSIGIAMAYWATNSLFEQVGNVSQLPASLAAWSPNALFSLAGLYFLARMKS